MLVTLTYTLWFRRPFVALTCACRPPTLHCRFISVIAGIGQLRSIRISLLLWGKETTLQSRSTTGLSNILCWKENKCKIVLQRLCFQSTFSCENIQYSYHEALQEGKSEEQNVWCTFCQEWNHLNVKKNCEPRPVLNKLTIVESLCSKQTVALVPPPKKKGGQIGCMHTQKPRNTLQVIVFIHVQILMMSKEMERSRFRSLL